MWIFLLQLEVYIDMGKKFKGFLRKKYVGSIEDVNKHSKQFFKDFSKCISENSNLQDDHSKLTRFIDLLKFSDVYINDEGDIVDSRYELLLNWILLLDIDKNINDKINRMNKELNLILEIKSQVINQNSISVLYNRIQNCNYIFNNEWKKIRSIVTPNMENAVNAVSNYFVQIKKQIPDTSIDVEALNKCDKKNLQFDSLNFLEIVKEWKYSDAGIYMEKNKIIVRNKNDIANAFVVTRNLNKENRNVARNKAMSESRIPNDEDYLMGLAEEMFLGLDESDGNRIERLNMLKKRKLHGITLIRWIECLRSIYQACLKNYLKYGNNFLDIKKLNIEYVSDDEIKQIADTLRFYNDFLDTPFFVSDKICIYIPAILCGDIVHFLHVAIKYDKDRTMQDMRGDYFERTIGRLLDLHGNAYCKSEIINNEQVVKIMYGKKSKQHEIDLIAADDNNQPVQFECKTFMDPFNCKDYRIEIDKMFAGDTNGYLENDFEHYRSLKDEGYKIINNNIKNKSKISLNNSVVSYFSKARDWDKLYMIFISNYIFPESMVKEWNKRYGIYFIHWFDFNKLMKGIPLGEDYGIVNGEIILNGKIENSIKNKFTEENIGKINDGQNIYSLVNQRTDIGKIKIMDGEVFQNVYKVYYE